MDKQRIQELYYILPTVNLISVRENGILSQRALQQRAISSESVADPDVQLRRERMVTDNHNLHDYANLYMNPRNAMMYRVKCEMENGGPTVVAIRVSPQVLDLDGVLITTANAATSAARFLPVSDGLLQINERDLFARRWTPDPRLLLPPEEYEMLRDQYTWIKQAMQAEVLVPESVAPQYITGCFVPYQAWIQQIEPHVPGWAVELNQDVFFLQR